MNPKRVGNSIKILRNRIGYTQHDLADSLGVTDKAVSKWERGLSVPDIAIITELSLILNCDVDNLLEGNISFLEKSWQGLLVLKENVHGIFSGTMIFGKPLVYILFSYFLLAGIDQVFVICPEADRTFISEKIGSGKSFGLKLHFISDPSQMESKNTMVVFDKPFLYGPNLTKYFQRAMSKENKITTLTVYKKTGKGRCGVNFDSLKLLQQCKDENCYATPIWFVPSNLFSAVCEIGRTGSTQSHRLVYAEPMGNGMIEFEIQNWEDVFQTSFFFRFLEETMGVTIYNPHEIAVKRHLIQRNEE